VFLLDVAPLVRTCCSQRGAEPSEGRRCIDVTLYKVVRIYLVRARTLNDAITSVHADPGRYLQSEFAREADEDKSTGWGAALKRQLFGRKR
jgi:hypothetical protein